MSLPCLALKLPFARRYVDNEGLAYLQQGMGVARVATIPFICASWSVYVGKHVMQESWYHFPLINIVTCDLPNIQDVRSYGKWSSKTARELAKSLCQSGRHLPHTLILLPIDIHFYHWAIDYAFSCTQQVC